MRISELIAFNDHQVVVCCKPSGIPTQNDTTGDVSLHTMVQAYCKQDIYIVHRLDRPVSGVVVFAKNKAAAAQLSNQFAEGTIEKIYYALVPTGIQPESGTLEHSLVRQKGITRVANAGEEGKQCSLAYKALKHLENYDLLEIVPKTGRTHQIRAQLAAKGHPVKGDVKYGSRRGNKDRSIHLHCRSIELTHPSRNEKMRFECPLPDESLWNACAI